MLRALGDLSAPELAARVMAGVALEPMLEALRGERRAIKVRLGGEERWIDAADAGLYRDALGAVPPGGLPDAFLADVPDALTQVVRRYRGDPRSVRRRASCASATASIAAPC